MSFYKQMMRKNSTTDNILAKKEEVVDTRLNLSSQIV